MTYNIDIHPDCKEEINKSCKKNPVLQKAIKNKMEEIIENPQHYKSLRYDAAGERRVHILKSFVLKFQIIEETNTVQFIFFGHHDFAYRR
ncbi:type II toxin-antitoxin system RelE/ParE family toxin [Candidatus Woesearchaeota archaeon]|nr:type II toxin-antitoxin system RelE/ParE family toxin [Candidatus Woesearchaeota archaeon]